MSEAFVHSKAGRSPFPLVAGWVSIAVGLIVLTGWAVDLPRLYTWSPGAIPMTADSAVGFVLCGISLVVARGPRSTLWFFARMLLASALAVLGVLALAQDVLAVDLVINELLIAAPQDGMLETLRNHMAITTAVSFILFAGAIVIDYWQTGVARGWSRTLATLVLLIAATTLLGYAYGAPRLYFGQQGAAAMSMPSAALFLLLSMGAVWLRHTYGFPAMMAERSVVGAHIRALLPMIVGAPFLVGLAVAFGYGRLFEGQFAIALTSFGSILAAGLVGVVSIIILRRAEEELYIKDRALEASTNGVVISDYREPDQPIVFVNPAFTQITGYDAAAAVGTNCRFLNAGMENPDSVMDDLRKCVRQARHGTFELRNRRVDGTIFWNRLSLAPVEDYEGCVTHFVGIMDDITDRREQQVQLQDALEQARAANDMRNTFVRLVSHELRTPLNAALTWIRLMEVDDRPETLSKGIDIVAQSIDSQSRLIDDLVDVTRIVAAGVRLESDTVDVPQLVLATLEEMRPQLEAKHALHVDVADTSFTANLDPLRLQQIVRNLLNNAAKYTPAGGRIEVRLALEQEHVAFSVSDTGKGLTGEEIKQVFEPFWRAQSHQPGLGVGLSIVAALVAAHNGTIEVTSDGPGKGSEFRVRLPVDAAPKGHSPLHDENASAVVESADLRQ